MGLNNDEKEIKIKNINNYRKEEKTIPNSKSWSCLNCDANGKCVLEANLNNHNSKNHIS